MTIKDKYDYESYLIKNYGEEQATLTEDPTLKDIAELREQMILDLERMRCYLYYYGNSALYGEEPSNISASKVLKISGSLIRTLNLQADQDG